MAALNPFDDRVGDLRPRLAFIAAILVAANIAAWLWAWASFAGHPVLLGTAFVAYIFGLRHAVDADHIAAIDNVVRKLMQDGKRPLSAGFFFSLGHSTVVVLASVALALAAAAMQDRFATFKEVGGIVGTLVSTTFLLVIGIANLVLLKGIWRTFERVRSGRQTAGADAATLLDGSGFLVRLIQPLLRLVSRSSHMYLIGLLFGLGFDTATEIGLLGISANAAADGTSFWTIMIFPALFTAAMALVDTIDSFLMVGAYGWAFVNPLRKLWYNLTITAASAAVAIVIGGIEALGLIADKLHLKGQVWTAVSDLNGNMTRFGMVVVGVFGLSWVLSWAIYKWRRYGALAIAAG